jgi:hypothetical protein
MDKIMNKKIKMEEEINKTLKEIEKLEIKINQLSVPEFGRLTWLKGRLEGLKYWENK